MIGMITVCRSCSCSQTLFPFSFWYRVKWLDELKTLCFALFFVNIFNFYILQDFAHYKSGIYKHITGDVMGGHAVKLIGWGTSEDGVDYWVCFFLF